MPSPMLVLESQGRARRLGNGSQWNGNLNSMSKVIPLPLPHSSSSWGQGSHAHEMQAMKVLKGDQEQRPTSGSPEYMRVCAVWGGGWRDTRVSF